MKDYDANTDDRDQSQEIKANVVRVSITKEKALGGGQVSIPIGDDKKIAVRLPAGVTDGKRFKIKGRNLLVVIAVEG